MCVSSRTASGPGSSSIGMSTTPVMSRTRLRRRLISVSKFAVRKAATASAVAVLFVRPQENRQRQKKKQISCGNDNKRTGKSRANAAISPPASSQKREDFDRDDRGQAAVPFVTRARCASNGVG